MDTLNLSAETTTLPLPTALRRAADRDATVVESDPNGIIIHVNDKFCKTFGYSREEMLGQELFVLSSTCHPQDFLDELWVSIAQGNTWNGEISSRIKGGNLLWQDVSITPIAGVDGKPAKFLVVGHGISTRRLVEEILWQQTQVINQLSVAIFSMDFNGAVLSWNEGAERLFGYSKEEAFGKPVLLTGQGAEPGVFQMETLHALKVEGADAIETRLCKKSGEWFDAHLSLSLFKNSEGIGIGVLAYATDITERKQAEALLRKLFQAVEQSPNSIIITDLNANIEYVNEAFVRETGYSLGESIGKTPRLLHSGKTPEETYADMWDKLTSGEVWKGELINRRKDGSEYVESVLISPVQQPDGRITHYLAIKENITERRQVENALRESEERFRGTLEQAAVGISHTSLDGSFQRINVKFCEIVGYSYDELIHMRFQDITFPADMGENLHYFQQLLAGEISTYSMEKRYVRKDQSLVWANLTVSLLRDADGTPKYTIGVIEDITERKQAEVLVEQFGSLLQGSFNEIYLFDANAMHFLLTSEGAEKNLGYSADELNQLTPLDIKPLFTRESFERLIAPLRTGEQPSLFFETVHRRKDGTTYPVEVRLQLMQGERPVFLAVIQDISERKQAELDLLESRTQLRELSAHLQSVREEERTLIAREVHDELGQILTALRMKISMLRMQLGADDPVLTEQVPGMVQLVDHAIQGVRDVAASLRPAALDMGIVPALEWLSNDFATHSGIPCVLHGAGIEIELDESRAVAVFRIVQEALTNVARHAEAGRVEIVLEQMNGGVKVVVCDDGRGFDPSALAHKRTFGLLGMRERALVLGGKVEINSTPGHGTEISILLPPRNREKKQWLLLPPG